METIGAYEAKTHLPKLLRRVAQGDRFTITKHGVPIAVLQPVGSKEQVDVSQIIAELLHAREKRSLGGQTIRELIEEGRR